MKAMKKVLAMGLALAMVVTAVPVTSAEAASAKLPAKKTYYVGKTNTLKLNATKVKKTAWSKTGAAVKLSAKAKKSVKVTAVKAGTATVKAKVTYTTGKPKTYKCTVTVKKPVVTVPATATVAVGSNVSVKATSKKPSSATVKYTSADETIATVDATTGEVTGVNPGTVAITATLTCGTKKVTAKTDVTVEAVVAQLSSVKQTASNTFVAEFTADASETITKDDFSVVTTDGASTLAVKSVEYSADGKSAVVTLYSNFANATAYNVTCKDAKVEFTAKVGEVSRIAISTASAELNVETPIEFTLFDADGIDVTPSISVDTTCTVSIEGDYSAANLEKASKASITMNTLNAEANVTVTYNSNAAGAQDVSATQKIICVDNKATLGTKLFAVTDSKINDNSKCAKFYLGLSDSSVSVTVGGAGTDDVYFCAKDANGDVISYDTYEVESSNDDVATATTTVDSGKFAKITVVGNSVGNAQVNVKATKNGKDTYYTIPVSVTAVAEAASMTVSVDKATMSNAVDDDYTGKVTAKLFDKNGKEVAGNFTYELETEAATPIAVDPANGTITAGTATAKTYTIKVTGSDNNNNAKTFTKRVTVTVKALPADVTALNLVYQIELNRTAIDQNPSDTSDDSVTARLYATYNGLFAGYVRVNDNGDVTIGTGEDDREVKASAKTAITNVTVSAKMGTMLFGTVNGLVVTADDASDLNADGDTFKAVADGPVAYNVATKTSDSLAKTGTYTIVYSFTQDEKELTKTRTVTVSNSVFVPSVTVTSRTVDSLADDNIIKVLKTDVDMNNNESAYVSIANPETATESATKRTVKSVEVVDNYTNDWTFVVPVNATFKTE